MQVINQLSAFLATVNDYPVTGFIQIKSPG